MSKNKTYQNQKSLYLLPSFSLPGRRTVHLIAGLQDCRFKFPAFILRNSHNVLVLHGQKTHAKHTPGLYADAAGRRAAGPCCHLPPEGDKAAGRTKNHANNQDANC